LCNSDLAPFANPPIRVGLADRFLFTRQSRVESGHRSETRSTTAPLARDPRGCRPRRRPGAPERARPAPDLGSGRVLFRSLRFGSFGRKTGQARAPVPRRVGRRGLCRVRGAGHRARSEPDRGSPQRYGRGHRVRRVAARFRGTGRVVLATLVFFGYGHRSLIGHTGQFGVGVQIRRPCSTRFHVAFTQSFLG